MAITRLKRKDRKNHTVSRLRVQHLKLHAKKNFPRPETPGMPRREGDAVAEHTHEHVHLSAHERHTESMHDAAKPAIDNSANLSRAEGFRHDTPGTFNDVADDAVESVVTSGSNATQSQEDRNAFYAAQPDRDGTDADDLVRGNDGDRDGGQYGTNATSDADVQAAQDDIDAQDGVAKS